MADPTVGRPLVHTLRVRYGECDLQGIVFNAHYLSYFDTSMTELWRAAFGSYQAVLERGIDMVLAEARLRFHRPARFDDELRVAVAITRMGTTSIVTRHWLEPAGGAEGGTDGGAAAAPLAVGELRHVLVDLRTLAKTPIPDWARERLERWSVPGGQPAAGEVPALD